ncbi:ATP-dependent DNA helicase [Calidifontibacter terrae]
MPSTPPLSDLLAAAVDSVGGTPRPGQQQMAEAVGASFEDGHHLLVQAGTGTGKSLAYLVPAVAHAQATGKPVIVATATIALQAQIVGRDLPRLAQALRPLLGRPVTYGMVKGRRNYLCQHKIVGGYPSDDDSLLEVGQVDQQLGRLEKEIVRLREWGAETESGDRDELVPGVSERAWSQVSVSAHECLGSTCPMVQDCFVEKARAEAADVDVVVTNHSFMAIDSFEGRQMLPEHDALIVDEAHELVDRVTSTITDELSAGMISTAAKRASRYADTAGLRDAGEALGATLDALTEGRLLGLSDALALNLQQVHEAARTVQSDVKPERPADNDGPRQMARAVVDEIVENCERLLEERDLDVAWVSHDERRGSILRVAPMSVAMLVRDKIFGDRSVVMTSATLELGGTFDAVAGTLGLRGEGSPQWEGLDVGSPFDYPKQAIAYVAKHLPPPGRDGTSDKVFDEIETLIRAAGGRTLGLFSSTRAAKAAAEEMRQRFGDEFPVLCQGDDQTGTLVREFAASPRTCLFGTMTLWQGVDVPGASCQLVIIDRIPFPRPDDPITAARTQAIAERGGNGFMAVSAVHAALRLAQGAGRLVRRSDDRGVVAFLDSRMVSARYAGFLQRSLPPFWPTSDTKLVLNALRRLDEVADQTPEPAPVAATAPVSKPSPQQRFAREAGHVETAGEVAYDSLEFAEDDGGAEEHPAPPVVEDVSSVPPQLAADQVPAAAPGQAPGQAPEPQAQAGWTPEDDEELADGVGLGLDVDELADHLDRSPADVGARLAALGLA